MRATVPAIGARFTCTSKTFMKTEMRGRGVASSPSSRGGTAGSIKVTMPSAGLTMPPRLSPFMIPTSFADLELTADGPAVQAVAPIAFGFTYAGIAFEAHADRAEAPRLVIRGQVGTLPFSAEGVQRRTDLKSIIT